MSHLDICLALVWQSSTRKIFYGRYITNGLLNHSKNDVIDDSPFYSTRNYLSERGVSMVTLLMVNFVIFGIFPIVSIPRQNACCSSFRCMTYSVSYLYVQYHGNAKRPMYNIKYSIFDNHRFCSLVDGVERWAASVVFFTGGPRSSPPDCRAPLPPGY